MFHKLEKRRPFLVILAIVSIAFCGAMGYVTYTGNQVIAKQNSEYKVTFAEMDKNIAELKAKQLAIKKAKEAAKKAAAQKAASDAALASQLQGKVVTPPGCAIKGSHGNPNNIDVVVNKKHCFNPINFVPGDLVSYNGYVISGKIRDNLAAMVSASAAAGVPLGLTSAYRSYSNQVETYNMWVRVNGSYAAADTVSARPGYSEHQTGFAVDFSTAAGCSLECFGKSAQYQWMVANAATYGFIERYPAGLESVTGYSPETWHWRYVGPTVAQDMKSKAIKTLEQLWNIAGGSY